MSEKENQVETPEAENTAGESETVRVRVPRAQFMEVWEEVVDGLNAGDLEGSGIKIVANRLGLQENTVQQRATKYRTTHGLPLSNMPRGGGARFNVDKAKEELEAIKAKLAAKRAEADKGDTEADAKDES